MAKIDIYSGFLGAGKTTLIKKLVSEAYKDQKIVIIENEFGEIGIDGGFLADAGVEVHQMNSGCICCSLTGDFKEALKMVIEQFNPDRIIIEPSGVGKLSEVAAAVMATDNDDIELGGLTAVVDASKCKMYLKNFGEFFNDQVETAHTIILSRTGKIPAAKVSEAAALLREKNPDAEIMTADWNDLDGKDMLKAIDGRKSLSTALKELIAEHVHELENDDDEECGCGCEHHHHHDDEECDCGCEHHHHHHDDDDHDHEHEHHHHHHHHHGDHDADEVFSDWGTETADRYTTEKIASILDALNDREKYGFILRAKGIVQDEDGSWIHFDFTPGEADVRKGSAATTGLICVIGSQLNEKAVSELFKA